MPATPTPPYSWDERQRLFRDARGRYVSRATVREFGVDVFLKRYSAQAKGLFDQYRAGRLSLRDFQFELARQIKFAHLAVATIARGGWRQMRQKDFGVVGQTIRQEYDRLIGFAQKLKKGQIDGRDAYRATLYIQAARSTYHAMERRAFKELGYSEERNVLAQIEKHCSGAKSCIDETRKGWVPLGTLLPIGYRKCQAHCHCALEYRNTETGEVASFLGLAS